MFKRRERTHTRIDTLIGRNASVQGDIEFCGGLHVDGCVAGGVRAQLSDGTRAGERARAAASLSVSEHGVIEGSVQAPDVVVNGRVNGDIFGSERVVLGSKAKVQGNVHYGVIEMALGAEISGKLVPQCNKSPVEGAEAVDPEAGAGMDADAA
jgi:cytoskeletal protein CcmA (bactofilin family)